MAAPNLIKSCLHCGKPFDATKHTYQVYCSKPCSNSARIRPSRETVFWRNIDRKAAPECWPWTAGKFDQGYGSFYFDGRIQKTHRVSWMLANGPIPEGLLVCHRCDNPPCCNPAHLFLGTAGDNNRDRDSKGRGGDFRGPNGPGAKLTTSDVVAIRASVGTHREIARMFGVSPTNIGLIRNRRTWTNV